MVWWLGKTSLRVWNSFFLSYLWEFALGMALATKLPKISWEKYPWWEYGLVAVLGTGVMVGMVRFFGESAKLFNDLPALAGYTAFCLLAFRISETHLRGLARAMIQLGKVSYPFFLVHMLVLLLYQEGLKGLGIPYNWMHIPLVLLLSYWAAVGFQELLPSSS